MNANILIRAKLNDFWLTDIVEYNVELSENIQFDEMKPIKNQDPFVNIPNINSENQPVE